MFKSIYVKYIVTFMVIIGISLILLLTIIGTLVDSYSETSKNEAVSVIKPVGRGKTVPDKVKRLKHKGNYKESDNAKRSKLFT